MDSLTLSRGLFRTALAAQMVGSRLEDVQWRSSASNMMDTDDNGKMELEVDYLTRLSSSLARCTEELLIFGLSVRNCKENGRDVAPNQFAVAIKESGLGGNSKPLGVLPIDSVRREFLSTVIVEISKASG